MDLLSHFLRALKVTSTSLSKWTIHDGQGIDINDFASGYFLAVESGPPVDIQYQSNKITLQAGHGFLSPYGKDCKISKAHCGYFTPVNDLNWQGSTHVQFSLENHYTSIFFVTVGDRETSQVESVTNRKTPTVLMGIAFSLEESGTRPLESILPDYILISQDQQAVIGDLIKNAVNFMANDQNPGYFAMALQLAEFTVISVIRNYLAKRQQFPVGLLRGLTNAGIGKALNLMYRHYDQPLTLTQLAKASNMSRSRFAATFKANIGETPIALLNRLRIEHAQTLLTDGNLDLTSIAHQSGFQSDRVFRQAFKRITGLAPREYRKSK